MRVVCIDDDPDDREFFSDAVRIVSPQISCITFDSSEAGVEFLKQYDLGVDFIFVDINMPRVNGYESVRELRAVDKLARVPIFMLTTSFSPADVAQFDELGIRVLKKASRMSELVQSIKTIFRQAGQLEERQ